MDRRKLFSIVGTIVLGALGSGLWELLKPLGTTAWDAMLTVSTLGLDSLKDGLYQSASRLGAAGARQAAGIQLLGALITLTIAGVMMSLRFRLPARGRLESNAYLLPFVFLAGAAALMIGATRTSYVAKVAAYCEQLSTIAAPYIDTQARLEFAGELPEHKEEENT